ncbi:uncharacterized protein LOC135502588 [Lineus longissimus]|uniref:uncharacterized protein LOC135502588 n=1 Tax=Lineus longissimus TaxID=88925 RepID=UPI00315D4D68
MAIDYLGSILPPDVEVKISKTTVNEHESVRFECATSGGYPERIERYQWLWKKSGSTAEQVIQDSETSTQNGKLFEFVRIPYDRSGTYSCKAWNLGEMGQASAVLTVHFSPRIYPEANMTYDVVGEIGKEASFELFIIANPTPATTGYTWSKDDNILSNSSSEYEIISGPTSSKLAIEHVKSSHYGNYTCSVKTSRFQVNFKFKLFKPGPPSAPSKLEVVNSTAVAATLTWISEINGGSEQRFYVQYKKFADNWDVAPEVPQGGITDPGLKKAVYHKIMGLESNVGYIFRVRSRNSHPGTHTSNFSNVASGETPEKPKTSLIGVNRIGKKVTVGWERVTGKYTGLKIKYCQTGTDDCMTHTVPKQENTYVTFVVDPDKSYYYYMVVEDGGDVVYRSRVVNDEVDDKTSITAVGGHVGAGIVAITGVVLAVILWKRGLLRWRKRQCHRPANDNADYDDTRVEFTTAGNRPVHTYANIETDHVNDVFDPERWHGQINPQPLPTGHRVPVHGVHGNEPAESDDDVDAVVGAYDYATWQQGVPGQRPVPAPQQNQTECGSSDDESGEYILSDPISDQEGQEPEGTYNDLRILVADAQKELRIHKDAPPDQSTAESSSRQANGGSDDESGDYILCDPISDQEGQEPEGTYNDLRILVTDAQKELRIHKDAQPDQSTAESSSRQANGSSDDESGEYILSDPISDQEGQEPEGTYNDLRILVTDAQKKLRIHKDAQPDQSTAESSSRANGSNGRTPSRSNGVQELVTSRSSDNMVNEQGSLYAYLDPVAPVTHGEYLDFRQSLVPAPQQNQTECGSSDDESGEYILSDPISDQEGQEPEGTYNDLPILVTDAQKELRIHKDAQPDQSTAESSSRQANGSSDDESGEYILSDPISDQEGQEPEGTYNDLPIFVTDAQKELRIHKDAQPDQSTAESSSRQANGSNGQTPSRSNGAQELVTSRSNDNMANEQGSPYAHLDPVAPVTHGGYLDFRQLSSE